MLKQEAFRFAASLSQFAVPTSARTSSVNTDFALSVSPVSSFSTFDTGKGDILFIDLSVSEYLLQDALEILVLSVTVLNSFATSSVPPLLGGRSNARFDGAIKREVVRPTAKHRSQPEKANAPFQEDSLSVISLCVLLTPIGYNEMSFLL